MPIDPARPPQLRPPAQQAAVCRRRLPDIPKAEERKDSDGCVPETAVVLRQRLVNDRRPASRPDSGVGIADLGVAATAVLYAAAAAANRDSSQSIHLSSGELVIDVSFSYLGFIRTPELRITALSVFRFLLLYFCR